MIRNLIYFLLLIAVAGLVYYLVTYRGSGTLNVNEKDFTVTDTANIGKIFIADMRGNKIELVRSGSQWIMNGRYPARKDASDLILNTLRTMAVRYPVSDAARKNVVNEMSSNNRKIALYDLEGKPIKTIYIGVAPQDNIGSYMMIEGSTNPFVVEVPGFQGTLDTRFIVDTIDMRSRTVIAVPFTSLAELSVRYNDTPDSSFVIDFTQSESYKIYNPLNQNALMGKHVNKERLFEYINFLKEVNCEAFMNDHSIKPSILSQRPFCTVTTKLRDGSQRVIDCYRKPIDERSKAQSDESGRPLPYDHDRMYGLVDGKDFVLLQYFHFGRLLKNMTYFKA